MTVRSIIDIDLRDGAFERFQKNFDRYRSALKSSPEEWAKVTATIGRSRAEFDKLVKAQIASQARQKLMAEVEKEAAKRTETWADKWDRIAARTKSTAAHVREISYSILKWGTLSTVFGGALAAGGVFGVDRLAESVSAGRRSALGSGATFGERRSFGVNFGRLVDPDRFLSSVAEARSDITQRYGFYGAGLTERQLQGTTGEIGAALLTQLKRIADSTDPRLFTQTLAARGLSQFATAEDLRRLRATSPREFAELQRSYRANQGSLDLPSDVQEKWQNFTTQMSRAGRQIEATFVRGLTPLVPGLEQLSAGIEKTVAAFLSSDTLKKWIKDVGGGLEQLAKYVGSPDFEQSVRQLATGIGDMANAITSFVKWATPAAKTVGKAGSVWDAVVATPYGIAKDLVTGNVDLWGTGGGSPRHNPGNLRAPGATSGFRSFSSDEEGLRAMARQLRLYQNRDKLDTITGIVSKYAPPSENDTAAYIRNVSRATGYDPNAKIDLNDPATLAKVMAAMTKQENSKSNFTAAGIRVVIENQTGGNAVVNTNQLSGQN